MFQVKEQNKTPEENPKEMVISNLPDIEFKENDYKDAHQTWEKNGVKLNEKI